MPPQNTDISITPYTSQVPTVQVPQQEFGGVQQATPEQGFFGGRNKSAGGLALGDSILKGFLKGHEYKAQKKAAQANATIAAADAATDAAHQKYQAALSSAGGDVNSPDAKAAYDAYVDVFNKSKEAKAAFVIPQEQPKGQKKKGEKDPNKTGIFKNLQEWAAANPHVIPQLALLSMKPNPPGATPDTKKAIEESKRVEQATAEGAIELQEAQRKQAAQKTVDQYSGLSKEQLDALPPAEQQKYRSAQNVLTPRTNTGATRLYTLPDGSKGWFHPDNAPEGAQPVEPASATGAGKIGTFPDYASRWAKENNLDPAKLTTLQIDALKKRYAWDTTHDSSNSTTVTPGIDSTTTTSSHSAGGPPPFPSLAGGGASSFTRPPAPRRAASGGGMTRPPAAGTATAKGQPSQRRAAMTIAAESAKANALANARKTLNATLEANAKNKNLSENPEALKQANDRANAAFQDELKTAYSAYDQKTIAMGGTPGGKKAAEKQGQKQAGPPAGATMAYKDQNGVVKGYAVNGVYVPVGQ